MTVCLGTQGNDFILNGRLQDVNAEEIYVNLTTPVFGSGVVYDCSNAVLMEQKKVGDSFTLLFHGFILRFSFQFLKFGVTTEALQSYVPLFEAEFNDFVAQSEALQGVEGSFSVTRVMAELTIYMASRTLQGKEVRQKFNSNFAGLYHDLDMGFTPINFMMPWLPLPVNRRRDIAQRTLAQTYIQIIEARRKLEKGPAMETDMLWHLMSSRYKNGNPIPDQEIAHMMIALLMAGQHSSSSIASWVMLRLASRPDIAEELYQEQTRLLGSCEKDMRRPLTQEDISLLTLNALVVKETLRLHAPIHSIMRAVKSPLSIRTNRADELEGRMYNIPTSHVLLSAPGVTAQSAEHFENPSCWDPHRWERTAVKEGDEKVDYGYGLVTKGASSPYLPFGAGRHRCIGEQFAYLQLGTITALMVRDFKLSLMDGETGIPGTNYTSLFTRPLDPAVIRWEKR